MEEEPLEAPSGGSKRHYILKVAPELWFLEEGILPHGGDFLWRVLESRSESEIPDAEVIISIVNGNPEGCAYLVPHELLFLFERILF